MKTTTVICAGCGTAVEKSNDTINRAHNQGTQPYCSRSCATKTLLAERRKKYVAPLKKRCTSCHKVKPLTDFPLHSVALDGRQSWCKSCYTRHVKEWKKLNPIKYKIMRKIYTYGLTPEMEAELFTQQGGVCAVCGTSPPLNVDHCHETGNIRGLLCTRCNLGLGLFGDNVDTLLRAIKYLKQAARNKKTKGTKRESAA